MSYPMQTVTVDCGSAVHLESSDPLELLVEVTAVKPDGSRFEPLVWLATGERFASFTESVKTVSPFTTPLEVVLPASNLAGWRTEAGSDIDVDGGNAHSHAYLFRLTVSRSAGRRVVSQLGPIFLPSGTSPVRLADLVDVPQTSGRPVTLPDVWSGLIDAALALSVTSGSVVGGDLILTHGDGSTSNVGAVVGPPNSLTVGTVTHLPPASAPTTSITGTAPNQTLDLGLVDGAGGAVGPPNSLTIGTVSQVPSGGTPTASVTGTAPNQTLNLGLVDGSPTAFELRGEGFPGTGTNATATNAASPGTYYTDTLGTNGAWRWLKTSAGTGNARWVVIVGDTGWRNVSGAVLNGWTATRLLLRRTASEVLLATVGPLDATVSTASWFYEVPYGFRAPSPATNFAAVPTFRQGTIIRAGLVYTTPFMIGVGGRVVATDSALYLTSPLTWSAGDPWPSTLPGTPA